MLPKAGAARSSEMLSIGVLLCSLRSIHCVNVLCQPSCRPKPKDLVCVCSGCSPATQLIFLCVMQLQQLYLKPLHCSTVAPLQLYIIQEAFAARTKAFAFSACNALQQGTLLEESLMRFFLSLGGVCSNFAISPLFRVKFSSVRH